MIDLEFYFNTYHPNTLHTFEAYSVDFVRCYLNYSNSHISNNGIYNSFPSIADNLFQSELFELFNNKFHPLLNSSILDYLLTSEIQCHTYLPLNASILYSSKDWNSGIESDFPPLWNFSFYPGLLLWIFRCIFNLFGISEVWIKYQFINFKGDVVLELILSKLLCLRKVFYF